ncbi:SpoIID/LytB domain-containing protein [Nocardioides sp. Arc9.136]|uniref:SpoIID/LytB domain-containing protein n=1 Tax=Nocardioides sp. Arc9.136 TaxID=2996826 RepID=UPI002666DA05|nr:SpoIID/LytB domain-containing protein [Nocardioides sp. Arc9.136]WKN47673.1 SpoIID/LytB domain-containing protein [Nocardioides sp. Arc9.136]
MRLFSTLAACALVLPVALLPGAAQAAPARAAASTVDDWAVPRTATVTITGRGYGHGHGMSQYGAEGAARQGLGHREIVKFYYPGTQWGTSRGRVTVALSTDPGDDVVVRPRRGLTVRDLAGGDRLRLPENGAKQWRIAEAGTGRLRVAYRTDKWRKWRDLAGNGEFYAGGAPVTLVTPVGDRPYRGRLRAARVGTGVETVNDLRLDSYLKGVVPLEIPATWSPAAVRAQAVAARTYASYERAHPRASAYQLCDTTSCQVYGGVAAEHPASNAAVDATAGQVLTAGGEPAFTQFASSSGGWTSAGSVPYLTAQKDPYDGWAGNPVHRWSTTVDDGRIERAWPAVGDLRRIVVASRDGNGQWGGRVASVRLVGSRGSVTVSGDTLRSVLGLRSTYLTFKVASR